jgi:glyoxylase-like metal-dependent hydrolase (beta-lactamase superfamily II)
MTEQAVLLDYGQGIYAFDADYLRPQLAAIHLILENGRVALVDTGAANAWVPTCSALRTLGLSPSHVDYIILTHIHLDHAGGAGVLMQHCPQARLAVHPRGARHMAEPSKLVAAVCEVYGPAFVERTYGTVVPVPPERIIATDDGHVLSLAGRALTCLATPGHARHHQCIHDEASGGIFTGDMFGLSYRECDVDARPFVFPTTTPSQFEPDAMHESIDRLLAYHPPCVFLTHYGRIQNPAECGQDLHRHVETLVHIARSASGEGLAQDQAIRNDMAAYLLHALRDHGCRLSDADIFALWETDLTLNAQGLALWHNSRTG